jgi:hypothetical protein
MHLPAVPRAPERQLLGVLAADGLHLFGDGADLNIALRDGQPRPEERVQSRQTHHAALPADIVLLMHVTQLPSSKTTSTMRRMLRKMKDFRRAMQVWMAMMCMQAFEVCDGSLNTFAQGGISGKPSPPAPSAAQVQHASQDSKPCYASTL